MATEAANGKALLEVEGVVKRFGGIRAVDGAGFDCRRGVDHGADRAQRRRQDDPLQRDHRLPAGRRRFRPPRRRGGPPPARLRDRPPGDGADVSDHQGAGGDAGDRQHDARRGRPARRALSQPALPPGRGAPARARGPRPGEGAARGLRPRRARRRLRRHALGRPAQAAGAGAGADDRSRSCCCSTSRWRASTPPSAGACSTTCSGCGASRG